MFVKVDVVVHCNGGDEKIDSMSLFDLKYTPWDYICDWIEDVICRTSADFIRRYPGKDSYQFGPIYCKIQPISELSIFGGEYA